MGDSLGCKDCCVIYLLPYRSPCGSNSHISAVRPVCNMIRRWLAVRSWETAAGLPRGHGAVSADINPREKGRKRERRRVSYTYVVVTSFYDVDYWQLRTNERTNGRLAAHRIHSTRIPLAADAIILGAYTAIMSPVFC